VECNNLFVQIVLSVFKLISQETIFLIGIAIITKADCKQIKYILKNIGVYIYGGGGATKHVGNTFLISEWQIYLMLNSEISNIGFMRFEVHVVKV